LGVFTIEFSKTATVFVLPLYDMM